jgi:hypothetical protein
MHLFLVVFQICHGMTHGEHLGKENVEFLSVLGIVIFLFVQINNKKRLVK